MNYARNSFHKAAEFVESRFGTSKIGRFVADHIVLSQKFIVPDAGKMLDGKPYAEFMDAIHLPFDRVSLLRDIQVDGADTQQICVAAAPHLLGCKSTADFFVADCLRVPGNSGAWVPSRPIGVKFSAVDGGALFLEIEGVKEEEKSLIGYAYDPREGFGALNALCELMLMLSLSNVGTRIMQGPEKLNKKRTANGKLPIYDYHVLIIDGQETFQSDGRNATDRSIRSHFRRGHIRRLDDSRRVWVRAAYVHGKSDGFVDKDYLVTTPEKTA